ncbi:MAG: tetratricopeptide repeat protein [Treponema sp.]|nr:tetratricopeptide repeat protein [Treponema sp.]
MKATNNNDRIVFLSVPESLRGRIDEISAGDFVVDPSIPLPVEIPADQEELDLEQLSWEMILSGMIKIIEREPFHADADYYRQFVLAVKPDILKEFSEAAILKARNKDFELSLEILSALSALYPNSPEVSLNRALVYEEMATALEDSGREAEAAEAWTQAHTLYVNLLAQNPPLPNVLFNAGFFYLKQRNYEKARDCFSRYIPVADSPRKKEKAQSIIKEISERSLDDQVFKEAYDFIRMGEEPKGIEKIHQFLIRHPDVWNGWFLLGWGLRRLERWDDAALAFRKALELGGEGCDTRNELALCLIEQGSLDEARKQLEQALRLEPENIKVISNLGILAMKQGKREEAAGFFRTVLEYDSEDPLAQEMLAQLEG